MNNTEFKGMSTEELTSKRDLRAREIANILDSLGVGQTELKDLIQNLNQRENIIGEVTSENDKILMESYEL